MKGSAHWIDKRMDLVRAHLICSGLGVVLVLLVVTSGGVEGQMNDTDTVSFVYFESPPTVTSNTTATFRWEVLAPNGSDPCAVDQCVNQCKLDNAPFTNCSSQVAVYFNLTDGVHIFTVLVSTLRGHFFPNDTSWTVDTVHPTANLTAGASFTNALNISVGIQFSEPCISPGFQCPSTSQCDVYVKGPGTIIPSSLIVHTFGLEYSLTVALSQTVEKGRVDIKMDKKFCFDAAGNVFDRTESALYTVHFSRTIPTVNMWTPAQDSQVQIDGEFMTISATSNPNDLMLNLEFSEKMATTADQLLSSLQISHGALSMTSHVSKERLYTFSIINISDLAIVSVSLPANSSLNIYGTFVVQTANITFLYDSSQPQVALSTTSLAQTKNHYIPCLIQFTKPVFVFGSENVNISGGNLTRFEEVSKSTYALELYISNGNAVSVRVMGNVTFDIAGNPNLPSNVLRVRHYAEPSFAVALYSFTTAGLIATTLASGALSISSATLAAAGALASQTSGSIIADPSRNLLGMATHLQVFALSDWLAVSLPVEYRETTRGLRWLIPHVNPPWQKRQNLTALDNPLLQQSVEPTTPMVKSIIHGRRRLFAEDDHALSHKVSISSSASDVGRHAEGLQCTPALPCLQRNSQQNASSSISCLPLSYLRCKDHVIQGRQGVSQMHGAHYRSGRGLGENMTAYGPALGPDEYALYFENAMSNIELREIFDQGDYTGWPDFARNMFWVGAIGGGLILLHLLLLLLLRWRTKTSVRGALTIPRFELFLLILALPCVCQASAFIIRGGTTLGIIVGVLLLAIPAAFLLSVILFLIVAIFMESLVQYQEVVVQHHVEDEVLTSRRSKVMEAVAGPKSMAKWVRKDGLAPAFLPRYGLFFEDRKGPPKLVVLEGEVGGSFPKWIDSGSNGVGRMRAVNSDDEGDEVAVPAIKRFLGGARAAYISVDICRRIVFGVLFGAFPRSDRSWIQVSVALSITLAQLLYLIYFKPFIKRGVQVVESLSLLCETTLFVAALVLLAFGDPTDDHLGFGIFMLALLLLSFVSQLVNEWYALMKQLLRLSPSQDPSLKVGLKMFGKGLVLPFVPRGHWARFISPQPLQQQPRTGLVPVVPLSPERPELEPPEMLERARRSTSIHTGSPLMAIRPEPAIPGYDPGSPAFIDPRNAVTEEAVVSGEITPEAAAVPAASAPQRQDNPVYNKPNANWGSQWNRSRSMEGKRSTRGVKTDPKSSEMKMLRDIAKASFPRWRKREEISDPGLEISSPVLSNVGTGVGSGVVRKLSSSAPSRVGGGAEEHGFSDGNSGSDNNSSDDERFRHSRRPPQVVGESSIDILGAGGPSRGITPHSSSSFEKGSRGSGPLETTLSGSSLPVRELVQER